MENDYDTLFEIAVKHLDAKEFAAAIPVMEKLVKVAPEGEKREAALEILQKLPGWVALQADRKRFLTEAFEHGLQAAITQPEANEIMGVRKIDHRLDRGYGYLAEKNLYKAVEEFKTLYLAEPDNISAKSALLETYYLLGISFELQNNDSDAIKAYKTVLKIDPDNSLAKRKLASFEGLNYPEP
ncbi:MAG: tetratricopeptide repeat protein [Spirochaetaceae bacterium]|jgi:tetratricopeptide (TPR) repeat protein|nr:tetratricopeptide repeat protein [Spirochaetaceae bacterium]